MTYDLNKICSGCKRMRSLRQVCDHLMFSTCPQYLLQLFGLATWQKGGSELAGSLIFISEEWKWMKIVIWFLIT